MGCSYRFWFCAGCHLTSHSSGPADAGRLTPALNYKIKLMRKISKEINAKFKVFVYMCILAFMLMTLPSDDLNPNKSISALIVIPITLICFILLIERFRSFSRAEVKLLRRYTRTIVFSVKLKNSKLAFKLISLSYGLIFVHQYVRNIDFIFLSIALLLFIIALVLIIEENTRVWLNEYQKTVNISVAIASTIAIFSSSIASSIQINNIFSVDADVFKNTYYAVVAYNVVKYILPPLGVLLFMFLYINNKFRLDFIPNKRYVFLIAFVMLIEGVAMQSTTLLNKFITKTALIADFNNKNLFDYHQWSA